MDPPPPARRILGFSTKMYFTHAQTKSYIAALVSLLASADPTLLSSLDIFIIPDFTSLATAASQIRAASPASPLLLGAQNCYSEGTGAFTGEVSPAVLAEIGCRIVELNHAERRRLFGETDETAALKAAAAVRNGLVPLLCCGELSKPGEGHTIEAAAAECTTQVERILTGVPPEAEVVLAYEPVWAIGAAEPAPAEHITGVAKRIKELDCVRSRPGLTRILYGGSAGLGTFANLKDGLDGLFLGRFAHDLDQFWKIIQEVASA